MRIKSMLAAGLTVVLAVGLGAVASQTAAAAQEVRPTDPPVMPPVPGTAVPVLPTEPDDASKAAQPLPAPVWPEAEAASATAGAGAVHAQVLGQAEAAAAGVDGLLVRVDGMGRLPAGEPVKLSVDYSGLRNLYGGDWASRLQVVDLEQGTVLPSANDVAAGTLATTVESGAVGSTFAVTADTGGAAGEFAATPLSPAGKWAVNAQSGAFTWSHELRTPPVPGQLAPALALSYSSSAVDGRTASTNNQPSWLGEGWGLWPGSIERSYRSCSDVDGKPDTGDLCWITENAVMSLGGTTVELVREGTSRRWRPLVDDGTRVEQRFDLANGDVRGEHWVVTTTDGVQYHYGSRPEAQSTWTLPVFGDGPGEGCGGAFATSDCVRAWRWNLDYVVDPHGNTMTYQYRTETNRYARNQTVGSVATYTRGGWLERIDYGGRVGEPAAAQVVFGVADRCLSACGEHTGARWPDVPWDWECTGATCPDQFSPTFWSTKRLATVTTRVRSGDAYTDVDRWTFQHTFPLPGDGTSPGLWLSGITHTGLVGGSQSMPPITFGGAALANRVDTPTDGPPPLYKYRIETIHNGSGGDINVEYAATNCTAGALPSPANNTLRCFPSRWVMEPEPQARDDWFHVHVVNRVTLQDRVAGGAMEVFGYDYLGGAAWRYDDNPVTTEKYRTWSLWRGYEKVQVRHGDPTQDPGRPVSLTQYQYFRGMHGDRASATGGTKTVHITDSAGTALVDSDPLAGFLREQITYNGAGGAEVSGEIHDPWTRGPTATQGTRQSFQVQDVRTVTRTALAGGGFRRTQVDTAFDNEGNPTQVNDLGDTATAVDDRCTRTEYARNDSSWLLSLSSQVSTVGVACGDTPSYPADAISNTRTYYDGLAWDAPPTVGDATKIDEAGSYSGSTPGYVTTATSTYDGYGRVLDSFDALNRKTMTRYTPATGPATGTTVTNPAGHTVTSTLNPAWGMATSTVDANQARTDLAYDPLGRLTTVWEPGRDRATFPQEPNLRYTYSVQDFAPSWVRTEALKANGNYLTSFTLLDGFLRQRQTQVPSPKGGRVLTDTVYDSRALTYLTRGPYYQDAAPGTTLVEPDINLVPAMTLTRFDGAERPTEQIFLRFNAEPPGRWRTSTEYGGDYVAVTPPAGEPPVRTYTDARGQTTELRQYRGATPTGDDYDATRYSYRKAGQLTRVIDQAGNTWGYEYDVRNRQTAMVDPDQGRTVMTYDAAGQLATTTDARGQTLTFTYDALGRKVETRSGSTVLATWTYDTLKAGLLTSSTRRQAGGQYTREFTGYDPAGRPTGERISFPGAEIGATGTVSFTTTMSYKVDGNLNLLRLPELAPDTPAETLTYTYDALGNLTNLRGNTSTGSTVYVNRATYTAFGESELVELGDPNAGPHVWQQWTYEDGTRRVASALTEREQAGNLRVDRLSYTYDPAGNLTSLRDELPGAAVDNQCFRYDYLRRLTEAWTQTGTCAASPAVGVVAGPAAYWHSYRYDLTGNRTSLNRHGLGGAADTVSTYTYPAAGQPHPHAVQAVQATGAGTANYGYNATGDTTSRPGPGGQQTLVWDAETNLESITSGADTTSYRYDADGAQLIRRDPTTVTVFIGDSELVYDTAARTRTGTRYYSVGERSVAVRTGGALRWLVGDHHGTNQLTVDPATLQANPRRFDPFGNPRGAAATWQGGNHGFVDGTRNDATGLTRLGAREYDPTTGRFISVDPLIDHNDPQQMNGYAYANNNPTTMADPDGRFAFIWLLFLQAVNQVIAAVQHALNVAGYNKAAKNCPPDRRCGSPAQQAAHDSEARMNLPVLGKPLDPATAERWRSRWGYAGSDWFSYAEALEFAKLGPEQASVVCQAMGGTVGECQGEDTGPSLLDVVGDVAEFIYDLTPIADVHHCIDGTESCWWIAANLTGPGKYAAKGVDVARGGGRAADDVPSGGGGATDGCSFSSDTPVLMADGTSKPIGAIEPGDQVLGIDPETGSQAAGTVTAVWVHGDTLVDLQIMRPDRDAMVTVTTTGDHPFWNEADQRWQSADSLGYGDGLLAADGTAPTVVGLLLYTSRPGGAYNLTVAGFSTYYVLAGDTSVLVHNCPARRSGKDKANDLPSWMNPSEVRRQSGESATDAAHRVMQERYPDGGYPTGPGSEFSKAKKYASRN